MMMMMMIRSLVRECAGSWRPVSTARHSTAALSIVKIATLTWTTWRMTSLRRNLTSLNPIHLALEKRVLIANTNTQVKHNKLLLPTNI